MRRGISYKHVSTLMHTPAEIGIAAAPKPIRRKQPNSQAWLARYGITITKLTYTPTEQ